MGLASELAPDWQLRQGGLDPAMVRQAEAPFFWAGIAGLGAAGGYAGYAAYGSAGAMCGSSGPIFGRGGLGLLNSNPYFRLGWGWSGTAAAGKEIFRVAIGNKDWLIHRHWP